MTMSATGLWKVPGEEILLLAEVKREAAEHLQPDLEAALVIGRQRRLEAGQRRPLVGGVERRPGQHLRIVGLRRESRGRSCRAR